MGLYNISVRPLLVANTHFECMSIQVACLTTASLLRLLS